MAPTGTGRDTARKRGEMDRIASFDDWMRRQRKALDLTQAQLAARVGCAVVTIKKIEQATRRPSQQMAELLADALAIPA
ncbi:MAG: helix-turn-helix transcriptional regulator, partial [Caldilineaceae bacterium]|nr:helix-turn-helix transcriptional regulator [Caldilineaceae bacterium]